MNLWLLLCSLLCAVRCEYVDWSNDENVAFDANHELLRAAEYGVTDKVEKFLNHGGYIEAKNNFGVR